MRRPVYYKRATKQFLAGTRYKAPFEMVQAGLKTLEEWIDLLDFERWADETNRLERRNRRLRLRQNPFPIMGDAHHQHPIFLERLPREA
jgi:hypothetical protein